MGAKTKIDWCDSSFNPISGCYHECPYCYARDMARRFGGHMSSGEGSDKPIHVLEEPIHRTQDMGNGMERVGAIMPYPYDFEPTFHRYSLKKIQQWKAPRTIFVCSMSDLFGAWVPDSWIKEVFEACEATPRHRYIFLTKNPSRYVDLLKKDLLPNGDNFWFGSTMTRPEANFFWCNKRNTFISIEPIMEPIKWDKRWPHPDWIIVGAETGNRKGRVKPPREWIDAIAEECTENEIPIFMKGSIREIMGDDFKQEFPWPTLQAKSCALCRWLTDEFTSVCCNGDSERCADFVNATDTCEHWEQRQEGET